MFSKGMIEDVKPMARRGSQCRERRKKGHLRRNMRENFEFLERPIAETSGRFVCILSFLIDEAIRRVMLQLGRVGSLYSRSQR